jgi:hypothetical protein
MGFNQDCYGDWKEAVEPIFPYRVNECDVYSFDLVYQDGEQLLRQWANKEITRNALRFHADRLGLKLTHYSEIYHQHQASQ